MEMYFFKGDPKIILNQVAASKTIGLTQPTLSNILRRKVACRKVVAFCIAKYIDDEAEISDYFEKRGE